MRAMLQVQSVMDGFRLEAVAAQFSWELHFCLSVKYAHVLKGLRIWSKPELV